MSLCDSYPSAGHSGAPTLSPAVLGSLLPFEPAPRELQVHAMGLLIASAPLKLLLHLKKKEAPNPQARHQALGEENQPGGLCPASQSRRGCEKGCAGGAVPGGWQWHSRCS